MYPAKVCRATMLPLVYPWYTTLPDKGLPRSGPPGFQRRHHGRSVRGLCKIARHQEAAPSDLLRGCLRSLPDADSPNLKTPCTHRQGRPLPPGSNIHWQYITGRVASVRRIISSFSPNAVTGNGSHYTRPMASWSTSGLRGRMHLAATQTAPCHGNRLPQPSGTVTFCHDPRRCMEDPKMACRAGISQDSLHGRLLRAFQGKARAIIDIRYSICRC
jgi:hypothetical protein